jgi:ankyrin repeat protein
MSQITVNIPSATQSITAEAKIPLVCNITTNELSAAPSSPSELERNARENLAQFEIMYEGLHQAIQHNDVTEAEQLVTSGASVKWMKPDRLSFLRLAVKHGAVDMVKFLFRHGVSLTSDVEGNELLAESLALNHTALIDFVLKQLHHITLPNFMKLADMRNEEWLRLATPLVNLNKAYEMGGKYYPIGKVCAEGNVGMIKAMIESKASFDLPSTIKTCLEVAFEFNSDPAVWEFMLQNTKSINSKIYKKLLTHAIKSTLVPAVLQLLQCETKTPIDVQEAVEANFKQLLDLNNDTITQAALTRIQIHGFEHRHKWSPIAYAASNNNLALVRYLIESGFADNNPSQSDSEGCLSYAIKHSNIEMVRYLLNQQYAPNCKVSLESRLVSGLRYAAQNDDIKIVDFLLSANASVEEFMVYNGFVGVKSPAIIELIFQHHLDTQQE